MCLKYVCKNYKEKCKIIFTYFPIFLFTHILFQSGTIALISMLTYHGVTNILTKYL